MFVIEGDAQCCKEDAMRFLLKILFQSRTAMVAEANANVEETFEVQKVKRHFPPLISTPIAELTFVGAQFWDTGAVVEIWLYFQDAKGADHVHILKKETPVGHCMKHAAVRILK